MFVLLSHAKDPCKSLLNLTYLLLKYCMANFPSLSLIRGQEYTDPRIMSEHTCVGIDMGVCQGAMFRTVRNTDSYFQGGGSNLLYTDDLSRILDTCN